MDKKNNDKLYDVAIIRPLAMILVVAYHAYSLLTHKAHFPETCNLFKEIYYKPFCIILNFHMPLFIFISGYLFSYLDGRGRYSEFKTLVIKKFKRLIVPYFVFATLIMLSFNDFSIKPYLTWDYWHLWFIPMLFWCFMFTKLQSFIIFRGYAGQVIYAICIFFIFVGVPALNIDIPQILGLHTFVKWYIWFFIGYNVFRYKERIYGFIDKNCFWVCPLFLMVFGVVSWSRCWAYDNGVIVPYILKWVSNLSIVILIWYLVNFMINQPRWMNYRESTVMDSLNRYSYGIYIFHFWIQPFMISSTSKKIFGLELLANKYIILFPFLYFVLSFLVSFLITHIFLKTKIGRFLIG